MASAASNLGVGQMLIVQLAAFLAALLWASGLHKLIRRDRAQAVVHEFAGVPRRLARLVVAVVAATEILAGMLLWMPASRAAGGALAVLIWGGYLWLILRAIAQGRRDADCGCSFGAGQRPLGAYHVARNSGLTGAALLVAAGAAATGPVIASQILAALALLALYGALDEVMSLTAPRAGALL
jgi:methylamine utilization protein MauE